jgi:hypothetical protein
MGLDNKICTNPKYWCRKHEVWLSEEDVEKKGCKRRQTIDMMSVYTCHCLQEKEYKMKKKRKG